MSSIGKYRRYFTEAECFDIAWQEWFETGHEYAIRDREFLQKGLDRILNFVLIYVRKN